MSNRVATAVFVPLFLAFPLLSILPGSDALVYAAVVILSFAVFTCSNAVSASVDPRRFVAGNAIFKELVLTVLEFPWW